MLAARFSLFGFVVGFFVALIIALVGPDILSFRHCHLLYGVVALVAWAVLTFNVGGPGYARRER